MDRAEARSRYLRTFGDVKERIAFLLFSKGNQAVAKSTRWSGDPRDNSDSPVKAKLFEDRLAGGTQYE